jgi:hypothetical protein
LVTPSHGQDLETAAEEGQLENPKILVKTIKDSVKALEDDVPPP